MFSPRFLISNRTLFSLIEIEVDNRLVSIAPLQSDWENRLKHEALIKKVFGSIKFEESALTLDDVAKIVKDEPGRDDKANEVALRTGVVGKERDIQQVLNLINASKLVEQIAYLSGKFKHNDYSDKDLMQINSLLGERLVSSEKMGKWRDGVARSILIGEGVTPVEIPYQMEDLFTWFAGVGKNEIHPILKAGIMLYELIRISPLVENNLLTAMNFCNLILSAEGYGFKKLFSPEEDLFRNPENFKIALTSVEKNNGDLTVWLDFVTRYMAETAEKTRVKVMNLVGDAPIFKSDGGKVISLSERQIVIMEEMTLRNEMNIKEIRAVLPTVSDDTILRDLNDLISKKLIRKKGKTKGAVYVVGKVRSFR